MSDIFTEVDEALKQEKLENIWQKYGGFFIGFLSIIVLGTGANAGYKSWQTSKNAMQTEILFSVTNTPEYTAENLLNISQDLQPALQSVAKIHAAGIYFDNGEHQKALETYKEIEANESSDPAISQLAYYMVTSISTDLSTEEKISRLANIINNQDNPWRYHAMIDAAVTNATKLQNFKTARIHLKSILESNDSPKTLQQKANSLDIIYSLKEKI